VTKRTELSVVIPLYNEEEVVQQTITKVVEICSEMRISFEIIAVDDGSTDNSLLKLSELSSSVPELRVLKLYRNSGHMSALITGLKESQGKFTVTIDADLQDPPELIREMYEIINTQSDHNGMNFEIIQTTRESRSTDTFFKRKTASVYYWLLRQLTGIEILPHGADFRMMNESTKECLLRLPEKSKVLRLLIPALGFRTYELKFARQSRQAGKSKYNLRKMLNLALDSIISFSAKPMKWIAAIGSIFTLLCIILSVISLILWLNGKTLPGWTSIVLIILGLNAFIITSIGIMGMYIGKIYDLAQNRPTMYAELKKQ